MRGFVATLLGMVLMSLTVQASPSDGLEETYSVHVVDTCFCKASMLVLSNKGQSGYVLDSQVASSIKIRVQNTEVALSNPPQPVRFYYAGAERDAWMITQLAEQGIQLRKGDAVDLISFTGIAPLFKDSTARTPIQY